MASLESIHARCVRTADGCLIWQGAVTAKTGYSRVGHEGDVWLGHRLVFTLAVRELEPGEHVDHTCHNGDSACVGGRTCVHRRCLEVSHLEAVTQAENNRRAARHASRTPGSRATGESRGMCKKGLHPWVPENIIRSGRQELCRACKSDRQHAYELRKYGPGKLSQRPVNPVWAELGQDGCRECGSDQNAHCWGGLCHTCINRKYTGVGKRQRKQWLTPGTIGANSYGR